MALGFPWSEKEETEGDSKRKAEARRRIEKARQSRSKELRLGGLRLTQLPDALWQLTALKSLDLSHNQLTKLPDALGRLIALQSLNLRNNQFTKLPEAIGQLTALQSLDLSHNQVIELPEAIDRLTGLQLLDLSGNRLAQLPDALGQLTTLQSLDLSDNRLAQLPDVLGQLTGLESLDLSSNRITQLPDFLGQLTALESLDLSGNRLTELPEAFGQLTSLQSLYLSRNQLTQLPEALRRLERLERLMLHDNPDLGLPEEVLGPLFSIQTKPAKEILDYYFRVQGSEGQPLGECKLIVVGRGGAGKTSLIKRLSGAPYDPKEPETHGIKIQELPFHPDEGSVKARVWDFGGQVVLHSMHEFFLTARSLYLLVLGERDDMLEKDAAYWLQLIRSYAGNAPVIVALNKSAGRQRDFDRATLEKNYGPILGWVATECSEQGEGKGGITELKRAITEALGSEHMESARRKFPKKWFAIKYALEGMKESFLDYNAYVARCAALGETQAKEQEALANDLHDLGVALNYGRDPRLRDTTVLRPDWLANGIYAVLRANDLDDKLPDEFNVALAPGGVVTAATIESIHRKAEAWVMLKAGDYPAEKRDFLLRLMDAFHLSYPLDGHEQEHLVPSLLPLEPPEGAEEPEGKERTRLRYEFQVVPAPLLLWFIAKTFSMVPNRQHWRRGTMMVYGTARARVWMTQDERFVLVTVAGLAEERRELLSIIRATLSELFRDYKGLQVVEQWEHEGNWVPRKTLESFGVLGREVEEERMGGDGGAE